ncbi:unnamed protein product [Larinioides sclopetarius]|uniref:UTP--glucose-1-phosphate uridylyltransferase n=1 Tax=Larinioides sclopetarius TaxID=280406 RepID=A0AAV2A1W6_9ARAC
MYTKVTVEYPRINKESLMPIAYSIDDEDPEAWYPPGHGDFYGTFCKSGLCEMFLKEGREFCFISNIDNLGATVDISILLFVSVSRLISISYKYAAKNIVIQYLKNFLNSS